LDNRFRHLGTTNKKASVLKRKRKGGGEKNKKGERR